MISHMLVNSFLDFGTSFSSIYINSISSPIIHLCNLNYCDINTLHVCDIKKIHTSSINLVVGSLFNQLFEIYMSI